MCCPAAPPGDADRGVDKGIALRESEGRAAAFQVAARVHDPLDSRRLQRREQGVAVVVKGAVVIMGMGVEIHGEASPVVLC